MITITFQTQTQRQNLNQPSEWLREYWVSHTAAKPGQSKLNKTVKLKLIIYFQFFCFYF